MEQLALLFPTVTFTLSFEEEQGWGGEIEFKSDTHKVIEDYENKCRDCDAINSVEYCDECQIDVCSKCLDLSEANPEDVSTCETHSKVEKVAVE